MTQSKPANVHPAFEWIRSEAIPALNLTVEEYHHKVTGALHYHLAADNPENVFLVALRTLPEDSTGVAHILEHTALCGSQKYPVRDPFFMMIRRSLNTFMNAFTSNDWTAYPFASQNPKDFDNLLDVYLDAVFFSRLDPLDFAQEGHRIEFAEASNPESNLVYKGVVFNEMKGAMSSVPSTLWHTLCKYLYPSTTYHYNSGGDPEHIPDLSYEQLVAFYRTHYHPSNAIFMTYGDMPAREHHHRFETRALSRFQKLDEEIGVNDEKRYHAPVRVQESYALGENDPLAAKTHVVLGWLFGKNTNLLDTLTAQLVSGVLLDNSASPLQLLLETTELGTAPSPLSGLDDSNHELAFVCGIEGSEIQHADAFERAVMEVLEKVAEEGVPHEQVEAVLHQLELSQREIGGDNYPYGLQLILAALPSATHRGDPIALLNLEPVLQQLRESIRDPEFIKCKVRELLLDNTHRVRLALTPDHHLSKRRDEWEAQRLAQIKQTLSDSDRKAVVERAAKLAERQNNHVDASILPKVTLDDVPQSLSVPQGKESRIAGYDFNYYAQGTNGIVYQQIILDLPNLPQELLAYLPLYTSVLTELGVGARGYLETQQWQAAVAGSISAFSSMRGAINDEQAISAYLILSGKALSRNHAALSELMRETLLHVRFDEFGRLRELVAQARARREQSVTGNGHGLAMSAATSRMNPTAFLTHKLSGLEGIRALKQLDDSIRDESKLKTLATQLQLIHGHILAARKQFLLVGEAEHETEFTTQLTAAWQNVPGRAQEAMFALPPIRDRVTQVWIANTQVNFCAKAYPTVPMHHADAPALTVLGGFLRNGYLHRAIREQGGAYGGGAGQDSNIAAFRFYSYRDPRLLETFEDFDKSIQWLLDTNHEWQSVEEAILGVVGSIDKPGSPAGEAKQAFHNQLFGRTAAERERFRANILKVTAEDLKRVARTYLVSERASSAVVTNAAQREKSGTQWQQLGWETQTL
jgi:Zn-dependent M16 (insulinase) family peptidase